MQGSCDNERIEKLILNTCTCGWYDSVHQGNDYINKSSIMANGCNKTPQH